MLVTDRLHPYLSMSPGTSLLPLWDISREDAASEARPVFLAYRWRLLSVRYLWQLNQLESTAFCFQITLKALEFGGLFLKYWIKTNTQLIYIILTAFPFHFSSQKKNLNVTNNVRGLRIWSGVSDLSTRRRYLQTWRGPSGHCNALRLYRNSLCFPLAVRSCWASREHHLLGDGEFAIARDATP